MKVRSGAAGDAVRRPGRGVIRVFREMVTRVDVEVLGRHDVLVAGLAGQIVVDPQASAAPPVTASEPPSQKSFCTSTMINARTRSTLSPRPRPVVPRGLFADRPAG